MLDGAELWVAAGLRAVLGAHTQAQDAGRTAQSRDEDILPIPDP